MRHPKFYMEEVRGQQLGSKGTVAFRGICRGEISRPNPTFSGLLEDSQNSAWAHSRLRCMTERTGRTIKGKAHGKSLEETRHKLPESSPSGVKRTCLIPQQRVVATYVYQESSLESSAQGIR